MKYERCINCEQTFSLLNVFTIDGAKETQISGMCETCFDEVFEDYDDCNEDDL